VATKKQIYEWIRYTCPTDTDAEQVAEIIATKLEEENGSSHNKRSTPLQQPCDSCGRILTARFYCPVCDNDE
jgi:hypothetical protein